MSILKEEYQKHLRYFRKQEKRCIFFKLIAPITPFFSLLIAPTRYIHINTFTQTKKDMDFSS